MPTSPILPSRLVLALLLACNSGGAIVVDDGAPPRDTPSVTPSDSPSGETSDSPTDPDNETITGGEIAPTWPQACDEIYDPDVLPEFALDFTEEDWRALQADCSSYTQQYHPVQLTYDGETVSAEVRLKGNWSWSCDKLQFVVSLNETDPDARFHGLRKLVFDAPWYDRTLLHERLAFPVFAARGLPYSCANNARVSVNGSYYGLYSNVERLDHEYLERVFEASEGNLYQGGSELKTNEDVADTSRLSSLQAARTVEEIGALMDLDQAVAEWATEAMLPAMDNYWAGVEINYYLYDHPTQGFLYLPYDLDITFGDAAYTNGDLVWPDAVSSDPILYEHTGWGKEPLLQMVLSDPEWCARFVEELLLAREAADPATMEAQVTAWEAQINASVAEDPRNPFSLEDHERSVESLKRFLYERAAFVDDWLAEGGHCPARW